MNCLFKIISVFIVLSLAYCYPHEDVSDEQSTQSIDERLSATRRVLISRLDDCTSWMSDIDEEKRDALQNFLIKGNFNQFRDLAIKVAREISKSDDEDCLKSAQFLIKKYNRLLDSKKRYLGSEDAIHIEELLSPRQLNELHALYQQTGRKEEIKTALHRFFHGMSENKKSELIREFFDYKKDLRRRPRQVSSDNIDTVFQKVTPEPLKSDWLKWQSDRNRLVVSRMKQNGADAWEVMNIIGDQFYHLRKNLRKRYETQLTDYCQKNIRQLLGEDNMSILKSLYMDNVPVDQIETRYQEIVGDLPNELDRQVADRYGAFCRKIFRVVQFKPADLTSWLSPTQKMRLGEMIQDQNFGDMQVYDKVYEFYRSAKGEQKEDARETIDTGCRHFIAHMFGDDTAEEFEDLRLAGNYSTQRLAARLVKHAKEISSERLRTRAEQSLPICVRIYLNYDGSCRCYDHSDVCDPVTFACTNCTGNTHGIQCHKCSEGFTGNPFIAQCTAIENSDVEGEKDVPLCNCNGHSTECDGGVCLNCLHNTEGDNCERCSSGFYGSPLDGTTEDCTACPCPNEGECFVNEVDLVQCKTCPTGKKGITCELTDGKDDETKEEPPEKEKQKRWRRSKNLFVMDFV
ncbi:unnamed protein product [Auanema sp. JU1783]|nr:unnamed protein product [Auanema sp. JU1783]